MVAYFSIPTILFVLMQTQLKKSDSLEDAALPSGLGGGAMGGATGKSAVYFTVGANDGGDGVCVGVCGCGCGCVINNDNISIFQLMMSMVKMVRI